MIVWSAENVTCLVYLNRVPDLSARESGVSRSGSENTMSKATQRREVVRLMIISAIRVRGHGHAQASPGSFLESMMVTGLAVFTPVGR